MLVDSHCHLHMLPDFFRDQDADIKSISEAQKAGVSAMLTVAVDAHSAAKVERLARENDAVYGAIGLHPNEAQKGVPNDYFERFDREPRLIAVGETGLDYYRESSSEAEQKKVFQTHIGVARELKKPLIIHIRDAFEDVVDLLKVEKAAEVGGIIHCYTGTWEEAQPLLEMGFYFSFSGIITFNNAHALRSVVEKMPSDRLLVETDAPFLTPVPWRGKANQPAYVVNVAKTMAKVRQESFEEISRQTTDNFYTLFNTISRNRSS